MPRSFLRRTARLALSGLALAVLLVPGSWANPLPGMMGLFIHVQPVNENYCVENPITACEQIQQYTTETGLVEFDIYGVDFALGPEGIVYEICATLDWSPAWSFVDWEPCQDGVGTLEVNGSGGQLCVTWEQCPTIGTAPFLIARVLLNVDGFGELIIPPVYDDYITIDCPPYEWDDLVFGHRAQAGVECAYCYTNCNLTTPQSPRLSEHDLALEAQQGETAVAVIPGEMLGVSGPIPFDVEGTEPWLTGELQWTVSTLFEITVTADAGAMLPGTYECWLRAEAQCADCARISFTVLPFPQGVEEEPQPQPDEQPASWGRIKDRYR